MFGLYIWTIYSDNNTNFKPTSCGLIPHHTEMAYLQQPNMAFFGENAVVCAIFLLSLGMFPPQPEMFLGFPLLPYPSLTYSYDIFVIAAAFLQLSLSRNAARTPFWCDGGYKHLWLRNSFYHRGSAPLFLSPWCCENSWC